MVSARPCGPRGGPSIFSIFLNTAVTALDASPLPAKRPHDDGRRRCAVQEGPREGKKSYRNKQGQQAVRQTGSALSHKLISSHRFITEVFLYDDGSRTRDTVPSDTAVRRGIFRYHRQQHIGNRHQRQVQIRPSRVRSRTETKATKEVCGAPSASWLAPRKS